MSSSKKVVATGLVGRCGGFDSRPWCEGVTHEGRCHDRKETRKLFKNEDDRYVVAEREDYVRRGCGDDLARWLSLADWEQLPSVDQLDEIVAIVGKIEHLEWAEQAPVLIREIRRIVGEL